jgi:hypothetical protein
MAAQCGKGPDVVIWAHEKVGEWADAGLIAPVEVSNEFLGKFSPKAWEAVIHKGRVWGYPVALETALIYNKKLLEGPHHWSVFESLQLFGLLSQRNYLSNVQKSRMFNHHPACVFGLRCTGYNFAETVQIEIEDLVIALPSQVDAQSASGNVFV